MKRCSFQYRIMSKTYSAAHLPTPIDGIIVTIFPINVTTGWVKVLYIGDRRRYNPWRLRLHSSSSCFACSADGEEEETVIVLRLGVREKRGPLRWLVTFVDCVVSLIASCDSLSETWSIINDRSHALQSPIEYDDSLRVLCLFFIEIDLPFQWLHSAWLQYNGRRMWRISPVA